MARLLFTLLPALLCGVLSMAQPRISAFEWWLDGDFEARSTAAGSQWESPLDMSTLHEGMHSLAVRAVQQSDGETRYSPVLTRHFVVPCKPVVRDNSLAHYEWWLDGDFEARVSGQFAASRPVIDLDLDMSALHEGLHCLTVRVLDARGVPGPVLTRHFVVPCKPVVRNNSLARYEWWLDGDFDARVSGRFTPSQSVIDLDLDMSALHEGLHCLTVRVLDARGVPGPQLTRHFIVPCKPVVRDNSLARYEWWIDGDFDSRVSAVWPAGGVISLDLDMSSLAPGAHTLSYRIADAAGGVGAVLQSHFVVPDVDVEEPDETSLIIAYGYWFNTMPRVMVDVEPAATVKFDNLVIPMTDIVPNHIKSDNYRFDVTTGRVAVMDDVFFGMQVFNDAGNGSNAVRDTIKGFEVSVNPQLQTIASGESITFDTPDTGHIRGFVYEGYEGDNLKITLEGTDVHLDVLDAQGNVVTAVKTVDGDRVIYTLVAITDDTYFMVYDASGEVARNTIALNVYINGDINDDRLVDVADLSAVINAVLGRPDPHIVNSADLNHDGMIDVADVALEINLILGSPRNTRQRVPSK